MLKEDGDSAIDPHTRGLKSKHKEHYDIIISEKCTFSFYKSVHKDFLPCHLFGACLYFTLRVTFVTAG